MTTLEELQALSDDQLTEMVAVEVMGWERVIKPTQYGDGTYEGWDKKDGKYVWPCKDWRPLTDWNHTMQVAEKMRHFELSRFQVQQGPLWTAISLREKGHYEGITDINPQRAICLAALLAISSSHNDD